VEQPIKIFDFKAEQPVVPHRLLRTGAEQKKKGKVGFNFLKLIKNFMFKFVENTKKWVQQLPRSVTNRTRRQVVKNKNKTFGLIQERQFQQHWPGTP